jgi:hypothetical protein
MLFCIFLIESVEEPSAGGGPGSEDFVALDFGVCPLSGCGRGCTHLFL